MRKNVILNGLWDEHVAPYLENQEIEKVPIKEPEVSTGESVVSEGFLTFEKFISSRQD